MGVAQVQQLLCYDLYFIEGALTDAECQRLAHELLSDPIAQQCTWRRGGEPTPTAANFFVIETTLRPGVTDPVAEQIVRCAHLLGIVGVARAATGQRFELAGPLKPVDLHTLAQRLLANAVIQRYALGEVEPSFPQPAAASGQVELIHIRTLNDAELLGLSQARRAALDLAEMQAIQSYYRKLDRDPTDVEFETLAQTWSEHCVHKTFKAKVLVKQSVNSETVNSAAADGNSISNLQSLVSSLQSPINGILRTYLRAATEAIAAPWVRSAFVDNAGIIDFDEEYEVSFKVETHNHPSAIEPFGGANTGVGGVIRDVLGVSAKPIAATDVLCFGLQGLDPNTLPEGVLHPRRIRSGVVAGIQDYGNKIGIPTVNGAVVYDAGYTANPLVFCGCVGLAPKNRHPRNPQPGDRVIVLGGRTGRDGLRGATFSSMTMDAQTGEVAGASVQIGDPITEKGLIEVITRARDLRLYSAITDCGAGGLSSAVGEMASQLGADVDLACVRLKYPGLAPWEIWLSEAQERMVLAVPPEALPRLQSLCDTYQVELTDIGVFTLTNQLRVRYGDQPVLQLANTFLHEGIPQRQLEAIVKSEELIVNSAASSATLNSSLLTLHSPFFTDCLLQLLSHPNIASKAPIIRLYDHEIQGGTVIKPLTGAFNDGPSDAVVLKPQGTQGSKGLVLANGLNPFFGKRDPYRMALSVVDEAMRNAVAVGADPERIALLDNFCWGDPKRPTTLGGLVEAARGCHDAALHYRTPFISGKDSLNNEYLGSDGQRHAIPPTLLISAIGVINDVTQTITMDCKEPGNSVYLLGETRAELGGSHLEIISEQLAVVSNQLSVNSDQSSQVPQLVTDYFSLLTAYCSPSPVPSLPTYTPALYRALHRAIRQGLVRACHDLSEGGLAVAAAEMCMGGRLGMALTVTTDDPVVALFSESNGRLLVEVAPNAVPAFENLLADLPYQRLGLVTHGPRLSISTRTEPLISLTLTEMLQAWHNPMAVSSEK